MAKEQLEADAKAAGAEIETLTESVMDKALLGLANLPPPLTTVAVLAILFAAGVIGHVL